MRSVSLGASSALRKSLKEKKSLRLVLLSPKDVDLMEEVVVVFEVM